MIEGVLDHDVARVGLDCATTHVAHAARTAEQRWRARCAAWRKGILGDLAKISHMHMYIKGMNKIRKRCICWHRHIFVLAFYSFQSIVNSSWSPRRREPPFQVAEVLQFQQLVSKPKVAGRGGVSRR